MTTTQMNTTGGGLTAEGFAYWTDRARGMTAAEIAWHIKDLKATIEIQEADVKAGNVCPKLGEYWDQLCTLADERRRRTEGGQR